MSGSGFRLKQRDIMFKSHIKNSCLRFQIYPTGRLYKTAYSRWLELQPLFGYIPAMPEEYVSIEVCEMLGCSKATLSKICRDDPPLGRMRGVQRFFTDSEVKALKKRFKGKAGRPRK